LYELSFLIPFERTLGRMRIEIESVIEVGEKYERLIELTDYSYGEKVGR